LDPYPRTFASATGNQGRWSLAVGTLRRSATPGPDRTVMVTPDSRP